MNLQNPPAWAARSLRGGRLFGIGAVVAGLALFATACGGDDDSDTSTPSATQTVAATGSTGSTGSTGATGSTGTDTTPTGSTGSSQDGSAELPDNIAPPTTLESFRWEVTFSGAGALLDETGIPSEDGAESFTARGAFISPDQAEVEVDVGGETFGQVIKGNQQWIVFGGVAQGPLPATDDAASLVLLTDAINLEPTLADTDLDCDGIEEVNGVKAIRCQSDEVNQQFIEELGAEGATVEDATFTVWIAEDGNYVARWQLEATGTSGGESFDWDFEANVFDVGKVDSIDDPS